MNDISFKLHLKVITGTPQLTAYLDKEFIYTVI